MTDQKNILLISVDDALAPWRYRNAFGATLQTPNIDRICAKSTAFTSAYCQVSVCGPSRASIMSGLSPYDTGIFDNYTQPFEVMQPEQMWSHKLKRDGFYCSTAGKVHHGYKPLPEHVHNILYSHPSRQVHFGPALKSPHQKFGGMMGGAGTTDAAADRQYYDFRSSHNAIKFLKNYDSDEPFYREVGFHHPHPPFRTPIRFKEMYNEEDFVHPKDWEMGFDLSEFAAKYLPENMDSNDIEYWRKSVRNYFSAYSHVDFHIGRVWKTLQQSKHADNTIVVLFSDHGYHMGDKGRFRKYTLWEEATRAPLIIHDPSQPARVVDDPVALIDIGNTVLDYAGCQPMRESPGVSLRPLVEGKPYEKRAIPSFWFGSASIRYGDYRCTLYQDGSAEFNDVDKDMWLNTNLAGKSPDFQPMRDMLIKTSEEYGVKIVEQGVPVERAASYYSVIAGADLPDTLPTNGLVSMGSVSRYCESPGYRKQFAALESNGTIQMADGVNEIRFAGDGSGGVEDFKILGNLADNTVNFKSGAHAFILEVHTGAGNDRILTSHDILTAYGGAGDDHITGGNANDVIYGGSGDDTIEGGAGDDILFGGSGNDLLFGGTGNDTIYSGCGKNLIVPGEGVNQVIVDGGVNRIDAAIGENTIHLKRTELPQQIDGFVEGTIDLSDWAVFGQVEVKETDGGIFLSCGSERVVFKGADAATVRNAITGISLAG